MPTPKSSRPRRSPEAAAPRVLIAPNAFKGTLTADEAARAIARGLLRARPSAKARRLPIADGGDGLLDVLVSDLGGRKVRTAVTGPRGERRPAVYALLPGRIAVVEMALASGLALVPKSRRRPLSATSRGTGDLIRHALERGVREVWIGMGGSATNDGGAGMARALGARFLDAAGRELPDGVEPLSRLARIDISGLHPAVHRARFIALSDVTNPLLGRRGSARVYGPQKGATPAQVRLIESALANYARRLKADLGRDVSHRPGAGAAGGLGTGLLAFLGAELKPGAAFVLEAVGAERHVRNSDIVVTGEGRLDSQSFFGKAPVELARLARRSGVPVLFLCGAVAPGLGARLARLGARAFGASGPGSPRVRLERLASRAFDKMPDLS